MRVFIATETKIYKVNNNIYTSNSFRKVLERYYNAFHEIVLCSRITSIESELLPKSYEEATSLINETVELDDLKGVALGKADSIMRRHINDCKLVIARVPSVVAYRAASISMKLNKPYMVEVVGCAWDSYWNYSWKSKAIALPAFLSMRHAVKNANYASYVTEKFLQHRYPCSCDSIHASNVIIDCSEEGVLERRISKISNSGKKVILFTAAAIDVAYKGQEYVIRALRILRDKGMDIEYRLGGNGNPQRLLNITKECNVSDYVHFLGGLPRAGVIAELDACDIYIQPSLQEGLPRSVIEAMSRGCPALGAHTAGIPELLSDECVFKRANVSDTARSIEMLASADREKYARINYKKALEFDNAILEMRRNQYYQRIMNEIEGSKR